MTDAELLLKLDDIDKNIKQVHNILKEEMIFDKVATWEVLYRSNKIMFVTDNGIELDFCVSSILEFSRGKVKIKIRE